MRHFYAKKYSDERRFICDFKKYLWMMLFWTLDNNVLVNYTSYYMIFVFNSIYAKGAYYGRSKADGILCGW